MAKKKHHEPWKVVAIIFIILFLLETLFIIYVYSAGIDIIEEEARCGDVCYYTEGAEFYEYDEVLSICHCLNGQGEVISTPSVTGSAVAVER